MSDHSGQPIDEAAEPRKWKPRGNGLTCPPWDIGQYAIEGKPATVLWRGAEMIGCFDDAPQAMGKAKEIEDEERTR